MSSVAVFTGGMLREASMRDLPRPAQLYLITVWIVAALLLGWTVFQLPSFSDQLLLLPLWLVAYVCADYFEVKSQSGNTSMNVADTTEVFLVAVSGPPGALVVALGTAINEALHRRRWFSGLFNCAIQLITYMTMLLIFSTIRVAGAFPFSGPRGLLAFVAIAAGNYVLNTLFVGTI